MFTRDLGVLSNYPKITSREVAWSTREVCVKYHVYPWNTMFNRELGDAPKIRFVHDIVSLISLCGLCWELEHMPNGPIMYHICDICGHPSLLSLINTSYKGFSGANSELDALSSWKSYAHSFPTFEMPMNAVLGFQICIMHAATFAYAVSSTLAGHPFSGVPWMRTCQSFWRKPSWERSVQVDHHKPAKTSRGSQPLYLGSFPGYF